MKVDHRIKSKLRGALLGMMADAMLPAADHLDEIPRAKLAQMIGDLILETPLDALAIFARENELDEEVEKWLRKRRAL